MTRPVLLDASCVLAWLFNEDGAEVVEPVLTTGYITSVNMAEVIRTVDRVTGCGLDCATDIIEAGLTVVPFAWAHLTELSAIEHASPSKRKLSLGDACCLSYGITQGMDIWTADRAWVKLSLGARITLIRT
ncbi:MAG: PIN domain-containing protein [Actinomycetales bacterium]